jgi:hypothetical protein
MEEKGYSLIRYTIPTFALWDVGKPQESSVRVAGVRSEIKTQDTPRHSWGG